MTERLGKRVERALDALPKNGPERDFAERLGERFANREDLLMDAVLMFREMLTEVEGIEEVGAHIAVDETTYPNGAVVCVDGSGNLVSVTFANPVHVDFFESRS